MKNFIWAAVVAMGLLPAACGDGDSGNGGGSCNEPDDCPRQACDCPRGIVNAQHCENGRCLSKAATCETACQPMPSPF